jgi:hypothetical protein
LIYSAIKLLENFQLMLLDGPCFSLQSNQCFRIAGMLMVEL